MAVKRHGMRSWSEMLKNLFMGQPYTPESPADQSLCTARHPTRTASSDPCATAMPCNQPCFAVFARFLAEVGPIESRWYSDSMSRCRGVWHAARRTLVLSHSDPTTGLPVGPRVGRLAAPDFTSEQVLAAVLASVDDDKAEEIVQIDLRGRSDMADYMVICSGRSSRQVASISDKLAERLKDQFRILAKMEGKEAGDWVLIDSGDVIVHVFRPEVREFYQLEKIWLPGSEHRGA